MNTDKSKKILIVIGFAYGSVLFGQDTRTVMEPVFPPVCTSLPAQLRAGPGGLPADSETLFDTARVQAALNLCPGGQAVELAPDGVSNAFLIAPVTLPAGVTLLVDAGVTVFASRNPRDYDPGTGQTCGKIASSGCLALITANKADGAGLMGYGAIDARGGLPLLVNGAASGVSWWDLDPQIGGTLARTLQVNGTNNFTVYKITFLNAQANCAIAVDSVDGFTVWGAKTIAPYDSPNVAGFCTGQFATNVTVTNSYISGGDDNIAINSTIGAGASSISVVNNHFGDGHGASIGSITNGGVSKILFDHISFAGDAANRNAAAMRIKSDVSRGGPVESVTYSNICMQNVRYAIRFDPFYTAGATGSLIPQFKDITLQNVRSSTEGLVTIEGHDAGVPTVITLNNVQVDGIKSSDITASYANVTLGPDPVNFGSLLKGTGVTVSDNVTDSNAAYSCPASAFSPVAGELIPGPASILAAQNLTVQVQVFPTKALPYRTYLANLKIDPNATLALTAPTGTVTIYDGAVAVGSATLSGDLLLSVAVEHFSAGTHTLTARYSGDSNYAGITFGNYGVTVVDRFASNTTVSASNMSPNAGDSLTLSAVVTGTGGGVPTGSVTFMDGDSVLGTVGLDSNGAAGFALSALAGGGHSFAAVYSGDGTFGASVSSVLALSALPVAAVVTLGVDSMQAITLTASVAAASWNPFTPSGTVDFVDGDTGLATVALDGGGTGVWVVDPPLGAGVHAISAVYSGDGNFVGGMSATVSVTVDAGDMLRW